MLHTTVTTPVLDVCYIFLEILILKKKKILGTVFILLFILLYNLKIVPHSAFLPSNNPSQ